MVEPFNSHDILDFGGLARAARLQEVDRLVRACHHCVNVRILDVRPLISGEVVTSKPDFRKRMIKHLG